MFYIHSYLSSIAQLIPTMKLSRKKLTKLIRVFQLWWQQIVKLTTPPFAPPPQKKKYYFRFISLGSWLYLSISAIALGSTSPLALSIVRVFESMSARLFRKWLRNEIMESGRLVVSCWWRLRVVESSCCERPGFAIAWRLSKTVDVEVLLTRSKLKNMSKAWI